MAGQETLPTSDFIVKVGNGQHITSQDHCKEVVIQFPNLLLTQDFYLFPLEGSKVVLGLAWLDTFGDVIANFKESRLVLRRGCLGDFMGDLELCYGGLALRSALWYL